MALKEVMSHDDDFIEIWIEYYMFNLIACFNYQTDGDTVKRKL